MKGELLGKEKDYYNAKLLFKYFYYSKSITNLNKIII